MSLGVYGETYMPHLPFPISRLTERSVVRELWIRSWYGWSAGGKNSGSQDRSITLTHARAYVKIFFYLGIDFGDESSYVHGR
jgi:hypothetical protein